MSELNAITDDKDIRTLAKEMFLQIENGESVEGPVCSRTMRLVANHKDNNHVNAPSKKDFILRKPNLKENDLLFSVAHSFGIKGCVAMKETTLVGTQAVRLAPAIATGFTAIIKALGFYVEPLFEEGINQGLADTFMVHIITT